MVNKKTLKGITFLFKGLILVNEIFILDNFLKYTSDDLRKGII